jgi:hypothetical protein
MTTIIGQAGKIKYTIFPKAGSCHRGNTLKYPARGGTNAFLLVTVGRKHGDKKGTQNTTRTDSLSVQKFQSTLPLFSSTLPDGCTNKTLRRVSNKIKSSSVLIFLEPIEVSTAGEKNPAK